MDEASPRSAPTMLDVDTGVDDALAIAYMVSSRARFIGVSTVMGNVSVEVSTDNTRRVLAWMHADSVPVHRGASRPLSAGLQMAEEIHGENGIGGAELRESRAPESSINGVEAILYNAAAFAGELVLVTLGPLTNVAIALNLRPELARQVGRLVVMGGAFRTRGNVTPQAEFNVFADPHAAAQVLSADWNDLVVLGLDVTHRVAINRDQWERIEEQEAGPGELVRRMAARTFVHRNMEGLYLHDPLATAVALDHSLVTTESMAINIALEGDQRGKTTPDGDGPVRVATDVDAERFEAMFADRLEISRREQRIDSEKTD